MSGWSHDKRNERAHEQEDRRKADEPLERAHPAVECGDERESDSPAERLANNHIAQGIAKPMVALAASGEPCSDKRDQEEEEADGRAEPRRWLRRQSTQLHADHVGNGEAENQLPRVHSNGTEYQVALAASPPNAK